MKNLSYDNFNLYLYVGSRYLEVEFQVVGEYRPPTFDHPEEFPELEILSVVDADTGEVIDFKSPDYPFKKMIEDYAWMEYDMHCAELEELNFDEPLEPFDWEER